MGLSVDDLIPIGVLLAVLVAVLVVELWWRQQ
jgi:hypothetical protein